MRLEELEVYQLTMKLGEHIWKVVAKCNYFAKDTIGKQLVRSADSISANLGGGYGKFFYKEIDSSAIIVEVLFTKQRHG